MLLGAAELDELRGLMESKEAAAHTLVLALVGATPIAKIAQLFDAPHAVGSAELAAGARARATLRAHRTQAEKLASAATGRAKRNQWVYDDAAGAWTSPYMERCAAAVAAVATRAAEGRPLVLLTDTAEAHGTPSNQGSARFHEWRGRGERRPQEDLAV